MTPVSELISVRHTDLYIDGTWHAASDEQRIEVTDPATGEVISTVASASVQDALEAVAAAERAFRGWAPRPPRQRAEILRKAFDLMMRDQEKLAELMVRENGKPMAEARGEVAYAAEFFRWFSEEAVRNIGSVSISPSGANRILVEHQPIGVSVLVTPWNFPAAMATRKIGPALAAGCTVILKPASETPLTALAIADLLEQAGVPKGVVNVIPSKRSSEVVKAMLKDPRVRKLSFTGSTEVSAATHRSSCWPTPISPRRWKARWWRRCATPASPASPPTASMSRPRSRRNSRPCWRARWERCRSVRGWTRTSKSAPSSINRRARRCWPWWTRQRVTGLEC
jgi:succinate-semialdehyde dehydrogenase/glutarate-semialdehyde dehydrogenase